MSIDVVERTAELGSGVRIRDAAPALRSKRRSLRWIVLFVAALLAVVAAVWVFVPDFVADDGSVEPTVAIDSPSVVDYIVEATTTLSPAGMPELAPGREWQARPLPLIMPTGDTPRSGAPPPELTAERAVLIDARSGAVLWGRAEHVRAPMASTVKLLTALTVLRATRPGDVVVVDQEAADTGEREIALVPGEEQKVSDLLGAMMIGSANDAATALAKQVGGTIPAWAEFANWLAPRLGARNTQVTNPHGLDEAGHETTAFDLAVFARTGLADPIFAAWMADDEHQMPSPGREYPRVAQRKGNYLRDYPGAIGVKTGLTDSAGSTIVTVAKQGGTTLIAVIMKPEGRATDEAMALLDWGFASHSTIEVLASGSSVPDDSATLDEALLATAPNEYLGDVTIGTSGGLVVARIAGATVGAVETS